MAAKNQMILQFDDLQFTIYLKIYNFVFLDEVSRMTNF